MGSPNFTFNIVSKKHGVLVVTAPERFRKEIESRKWHAKGNRFVYVTTYDDLVNGKRHALTLHRLIWQLAGNPATPDIDHRDRRPLNNSEDNLRAATRTENMRNRGMQRSNASGAIGVSWSTRRSRWRAAIRYGGKMVHLGYFDSVEDARLVRDAAAARFHGEFAVLNQPATGEQRQ
jgi:hypothetical protein